MGDVHCNARRSAVSTSLLICAMTDAACVIRVGSCDETNWPDKDHDLVCDECKVLVDNMAGTYSGKCDEYCAVLGKQCVGAWEEKEDTCSVLTPGACSVSFGSTSDAICECSPDRDSSARPLYNYAGCFKDRSSMRDLEDDTQLDMTFPTRDTCRRHCQGYRYMGLQWENECFCGNSYASLGPVEDPAATCGDQGELCGTGKDKQCSYSNAIYSLIASVNPHPRDTEWCARHGLDESEWSNRVGLTPGKLRDAGTNCRDLFEAGCDIDLHDQFPSFKPGSLLFDVCPETCGTCPNGDGINYAPERPDMVSIANMVGTASWSCSELSPNHLEFRCPDVDTLIGGPAENASPWSHEVFGARQRAWLERELAKSKADWKIVSGDGIPFGSH